MEKMKLSLIELFSGIGAQKKGLERSGLFDVDVIATSDISKEAILSYAAVHCELTPELIKEYKDYPDLEVMRSELLEKNIGYDFKAKKNPLEKAHENVVKKFWLATRLSKNIGDVSKVTELPYCDLLTYSFPCTDISLSGKRQGLVKGVTRSGLLYEVERLLWKSKENNTLPKYLLLENVKNLVQKEFKPDFDRWLDTLESIGYNNYWKVMKASDYGVPQSRERVFCVSIRKDVDTGRFEFEEPFGLKSSLLDNLDAVVDDKYTINNEHSEKLLASIDYEEFKDDIITPVLLQDYGEKFVKKINISPTLCARDWKGLNNYGQGAVIVNESKQ